MNNSKKNRPRNISIDYAPSWSVSASRFPELLISLTKRGSSAISVLTELDERTADSGTEIRPALGGNGDALGH
jgi:hypothetical protein